VPDPGPNWSWWLAPLALLVALLMTLAASVVIYAVVAVFGGSVDGSGDGAVNVVLTVAQDGAFIGAAVLLAISAGPLRAADFGLRSTPFWRAVGWAVLAGAVYLLFAGIWSGVVGNQKQDDLFDSLGVSRGALEVALLAVLVCVVAPIAEEFLFRGFCFAALRPTFGVIGAALAVGLVFGGIHATSTPAVLLVPLGVLGFTLCLLRWKTGSLYPCIAIHALNNSVAYGSLQHWGWQVPLLAVGALAAIALILRPFNERERRVDRRRLAA
jgi:membrane protease YdiL (CAAX protease family)